MASRDWPPRWYTLRNETGEGAPSPGQKASLSDGPDSPSNGMLRRKTDNSAAEHRGSWLARGDPLLNARLQQISFGQSQPQIGYVSEIIGPDDLHDIGPSRFTL